MHYAVTVQLHIFESFWKLQLSLLVFVCVQFELPFAQSARMRHSEQPEKHMYFYSVIARLPVGALTLVKTQNHYTLCLEKVPTFKLSATLSHLTDF